MTTQARPDSGPSATLRALVVEDDPAIGLIVETILTAANFRTVLHITGDTAQTAADADLLVTDLTLPGALGGIALSQALRARAPGLAVIYMSGALDESTPPPGAVPGAALLGKPFRRAHLLDAVTRALAWRPQD